MVQCDFDDTISIGNVSTAIREVFGPEGWEQMEEEYLSGKCSVEESNIRQFALVHASKTDIEDFVLGDVVIRYAFDQFVDYCNGEGVRLVVVSSGLDLYIHPALEQFGLDHLEVHSGKASVDQDGIHVEYRDPTGAVITQGFKESYLRHFQSEGNTVIYIGDGRSDIVPAAEADFVIARSTLESHLKANDLPHYSFDTFDDVGKHVEEIRQRVGG